MRRTTTAIAWGAAAMLATAAGCGSRTGLLAGDADAQSEADGDAGGCTANSECPTGDWCLFPLGDCAAQGQCLSAATHAAVCNIAVTLCGCDGQRVPGLCGQPYAFGPTPGPADVSPCADAAAAPSTE